MWSLQDLAEEEKRGAKYSGLFIFLFACFILFISFLVLIWSNPKHVCLHLPNSSASIARHFNLERLVLSPAVLRLRIWEISKLQAENRCEGWAEVCIYWSINPQNLCFSLFCPFWLLKQQEGLMMPCSLFIRLNVSYLCATEFLK